MACGRRALQGCCHERAGGGYLEGSVAGLRSRWVGLHTLAVLAEHRCQARCALGLQDQPWSLYSQAASTHELPCCRLMPACSQGQRGGDAGGERRRGPCICGVDAPRAAERECVLQLASCCADSHQRACCTRCPTAGISGPRGPYTCFSCMVILITLSVLPHASYCPRQVRFIEYMPFDGNVWSDSKMVPFR